jgi:hypothetical protein
VWVPRAVTSSPHCSHRVTLRVPGFELCLLAMWRGVYNEEGLLTRLVVVTGIACKQVTEKAGESVYSNRFCQK